MDKEDGNLDKTKQREIISLAVEHQAVVCVSGDANVYRWWRGICLGLFLWAMFCGIGCRDHGNAVILGGEDPAAESSEAGSESDQDSNEIHMGDGRGSEDTSPLSTEGSRWIYVHICGQVCDPGVYLLMEGSRVWDAVEAAGGLTKEAQPSAVNLAFCLADGSKVTIPSASEAEEGTFDWYVVGEGELTESRAQVEMDAVTDSGRVDINRADVKALMTIPGIGQARAEAIVSYRERQGDFQTIEEIMNVTGIKEGLFASIRDYIIVGG